MKSPAPPDSPTGHGVVVGASLAGLFAARVLSRSGRFDRITVLDHDELTDDPGPRRGVGQAHHSHVLLDTGIDVVEDLFEGLTEELESFGAGVADAAGDMRWFQEGQWKPKFPSGVRLFWCERPRFEWAIRQRLRGDDGVDLVGGHKVVDFLSSTDGRSITGVRAEASDGNGREEWPAELVVDAMGRGTRTPGIIEDLGIDSFDVHRCSVDLSYTSCKVTYPDDYDGSWKTMTVFPKIPDETKMGVVYPVDNERFHVTFVGWCGDYCPTDEEGFRDYAKALPHPEIADVLEGTERLTKLRRFRIPEAIWRRYDKVDDWPAGLICVGDAVCNFNPVYGQGMTVCAREAAALQNLLEGRPRRRGSTPIFDASLGRSFQQSVAEIVRVPWLISNCQDQRYPQVSGDGKWLSHLGGLVRHIAEASGEDRRVHQAFLKVLALKSSPLCFLNPPVAGRVLQKSVSRKLSTLLP